MSYPEAAQVRLLLLQRISRLQNRQDMPKTDSILQQVLIPYYFSMLQKKKNVQVPPIDPWRKAYLQSVHLLKQQSSRE